MMGFIDTDVEQVLQIRGIEDYVSFALHETIVVDVDEFGVCAQRWLCGQPLKWDGVAEVVSHFAGSE